MWYLQKLCQSFPEGICTAGGSPSQASQAAQASPKSGAPIIEGLLIVRGVDAVVRHSVAVAWRAGVNEHVLTPAVTVDVRYDSVEH